jgi:hypothetical protein
MKKLKLSIVAITQVVVVQLTAQTIINSDSIHHNRAYIKAGVEPATMMTFGYQRNMLFLRQQLTTYAEWNVSIPRFSFDNSELKIGGILPVFKKGEFMIVNNLNFSAGSNITRSFDSKKFAVADELAIGLYKNTWFIAATAEYEKIYLNYIELTPFYRATYYEDAKDGWYKGAGGIFQFGIEGGITIKKRCDIHLEIKMPFTGKFNAYSGSPAHANIGFGYRF